MTRHYLLAAIMFAAGFVAAANAASDRLNWTIRAVPEPRAEALLRVTPDRPDWTYAVGDTPRFKISVALKPYPIDGITVTYRIGPEMFEGSERKIAVPAGGVVVDGGTLAQPGFMRCIATATVGGKAYRSVATAALSPERVLPTQIDPADFDKFWSEQTTELAKVPLDVQLTPSPELSDDKFEVTYVSVQNVGPRAGPSRVYGTLIVPRGPGPFPAVLRVPGAGVRPYPGFRLTGATDVITFQIGIHGIPVNLPEQVYRDLATGALADYNRANLDDASRYYYRRVYLGCVRANDFLTTLPQWDRKNLVVTGGSQGGQLAIVTAALDPRVTALAANFPAYCDVTGYLHGLAGGWPGFFRDGTAKLAPPGAPEDPRIVTTRYYDVVNFARRVKVPGHYWQGYNDDVCPPTSTFSAYNLISAPKQIVIAPQQDHSAIPEQALTVDAWIVSRFDATKAASAPLQN